MNPRLILLLYKYRKPIAAIVGGLLALIVAFVAIIMGFFVSAVPAASDEQVAIYQQAAQNLTAPDGTKLQGVDWHMLAALDAVLRRQDFSQVTIASVQELARHYIQTIHHAGGGSCKPGDPHCSCQPKLDDHGQPDNPPKQVCKLEDWDSYQLLSTDQVMDSLMLSADQKEQARQMAQADISGACKGWTPPPNSLYVWPVPGPITECFGPRSQPIDGAGNFHTGIDIAPPEGTPIRAASDGRVLTVQANAGNYGNLVIIQEPGGGLQTWYAHLQSFADGLYPGQTVHKGDVIGYVGNTGLSTGPHLHFETRPHGGPPVDPTTVY